MVGKERQGGWGKHRLRRLLDLNRRLLPYLLCILALRQRVWADIQHKDVLLRLLLLLLRRPGAAACVLITTTAASDDSVSAQVCAGA